MSGLWLASYLILWAVVIVEAYAIHFLVRTRTAGEEPAEERRQPDLLVDSLPDVVVSLPDGSQSSLNSQVADVRALVFVESKDSMGEVARWIEDANVDWLHETLFVTLSDEGRVPDQAKDLPAGVSSLVGARRGDIELSVRPPGMPFAILLQDGVIQGKAIVTSPESIRLLLMA